VCLTEAAPSSTGVIKQCTEQFRHISACSVLSASQELATTNSQSSSSPQEPTCGAVPDTGTRAGVTGLCAQGALMRNHGVGRVLVKVGGPCSSVPRVPKKGVSDAHCNAQLSHNRTLPAGGDARQSNASWRCNALRGWLCAAGLRSPRRAADAWRGSACIIADLRVSLPCTC